MGSRVLTPRLVAWLLAAPPEQRARGRAGVERAMARGLRAAAAIPQWRNVVSPAGTGIAGAETAAFNPSRAKPPRARVRRPVSTPRCELACEGAVFGGVVGVRFCRQRRKTRVQARPRVRQAWGWSCPRAVAFR
jgi:hypothetical protein